MRLASEIRRYHDHLMSRTTSLAAPIKLACVTGGVASLLGLAGWLSWFLDFFSHFQAQYFCFQSLCVVGLLALKQHRWALLAGLFLCVPVFNIAPYYLSKPEADKVSPEGLRVVAFNVHSDNTRHKETVAWVRKTDPDIACFTEATAQWAASLYSLESTMPHVLSHPREDNFGWVVRSKHPILEHELIPSNLLDAAMIRIVVEISGRRVSCFCVHPLPPISPAYAADQTLIFKDLAERVRTESSPVIVMGDFNATPWNHRMRQLRAAGLRDSQLGYGFSATWQRGNPIFAIPIDLLLVSGDITTTARWTGPDLGSDHRPIVAELRFPRLPGPDH